MCDANICLAAGGGDVRIGAVHMEVDAVTLQRYLGTWRGQAKRAQFHGGGDGVRLSWAESWYRAGGDRLSEELVASDGVFVKMLSPAMCLVREKVADGASVSDGAVGGWEVVTVAGKPAHFGPSRKLRKEFGLVGMVDKGWYICVNGIEPVVECERMSVEGCPDVMV